MIKMNSAGFVGGGARSLLDSRDKSGEHKIKEFKASIAARTGNRVSGKVEVVRGCRAPESTVKKPSQRQENLIVSPGILKWNSSDPVHAR
jgi:hypothetical protein